MNTISTEGLADSLAWLCQHYQRPFPRAEIEGFLAEDVSENAVPEAAARCGLEATWCPGAPSRAPDWHFPLLFSTPEGFSLLVRPRKNGPVEQIHPQAPTSAVPTDPTSLPPGYWRLRPRYVPAEPEVENHDGWHWRAVWAYWPWYGEVALASVLINSFALAMPLFVMNVYDRVVPHAAYETLWALASGVLIVLGLDFALRSARALWLDTAGKNIDWRLAARIHAHLLNLPLAKKPTSTGALAARLQEFEGFREFFSAASLAVVIDLPFILLFIGLIAWIGGPLAWLPLAAVPLVLLVALGLQWPLRGAVQRQMQAASAKQGALVDTFRNLETVKAHNAASQLQPRWERMVEEGSRASLTVKSWSAATVHFSQFAQQAAYLAVVIAGVYQIGAGQLSMGGLIACTILTGRALAPLAQLATLIARYHQSRSALRGVREILATAPERPPPEQREYVAKRHWRGELALTGVTFTYPGQARPVLEDIDLRIEPGEKVALVGHSGSGKTTLTRLLLHLHAPDRGQVACDGIHLAQLDPLELRRHIGYVAQDGGLLQATLRDNLRLGHPEADDEPLLQAAHATGLDEWLRRAPDGLGLRLGENGAGVSGGQRQLIALTRSLVGDPPILIWDEPANALDNHAEQLLKTRLRPLLEDKTVILSTHRASLLSLVDRVVVLAQGKIVADGSRERVLAELRGEKKNT